MTTFTDDQHAATDATFGPCGNPGCPTGRNAEHPEEVEMHASTRPAKDTSAEPRLRVVETDAYDTGPDEIRSAVPEGFGLLSLVIDRD